MQHSKLSGPISVHAAPWGRQHTFLDSMQWPLQHWLSLEHSPDGEKIAAKSLMQQVAPFCPPHSVESVQQGLPTPGTCSQAWPT